MDNDREKWSSPWDELFHFYIITGSLDMCYVFHLMIISSTVFFACNLKILLSCQL